MGLIYLKKTYDMEQASILWAKEEIKCSNIVKQYKYKVDDVTKEIIKELNPNLPQIPVNPYNMLIT